jgi:sporulation protein YunB
MGLCFVIFAFCLVIFLNIRIFGLVSSISKAEIQTNLTRTVNSSVYKELTENPEIYSSLASIEKKSDGSVASMNIDQSKLLFARSRLVSELLADIKTTDALRVDIPIGNLTGINILSGIGPTISVNTILTKAFNAYFESSFTEVGINQSLYQINFIVSYEIDALIPSRVEKISLSQSFPVMSTVIVGDVPDALTQIVRLTDDITEEDIDDIFDFGAELN